MEQAAILMGKAAGVVENPTTIPNYLGWGTYIGEVRQTDADGLGVHSREDGSVFYEGEWAIKYHHGLGVIRWYTNGNVMYAGQFEGGDRHGLGVWRNEDGSVKNAGRWDQNEFQTAP
eukprot:GHVU01188258.1.p2 GENE.GHVU01188258.1~~GHVU01188258.1.p2  ORF type:complete len:127 (-),score=18.45 GHVU01188258.1:8-358(-)